MLNYKLVAPLVAAFLLHFYEARYKINYYILMGEEMEKKLHELWKRHSGKIFIFGGLLLFLVIPFIVDKCIIGNSFPSNIESSDWISFLGGYVGGGFSLIGIGVTIWYTNKQARIDRMLACSPMLVFKSIDESHQDINIRIINFENQEKRNKQVNFNMGIRNLGNGTALNLQIYESILEIWNGKKIISKEQRTLAGSIAFQEMIEYSLAFNVPIENRKINEKYYATIKLKVKYNDLICTEYSQEVEFEIYILSSESHPNMFTILSGNVKFEHPKKIH